MRLRSGLFIVLLLMITGCDQSAQVRKIEDPFPNASEVRLFVGVDYDKNSGEPILSKENGVILSTADRERFEDTLHFKAMPDVMAMCFVPHHFFRYFDNKGKQVGEVAVCFCCAGTAASGSDRLNSKPDEILDADMKALEKLVLDLGESTQVLCE
jgi:hypothetical protein